MSRPKGSKNKKTIEMENKPINFEEIDPMGKEIREEVMKYAKRGRGRPKGAKAKPKEIKETSDELRRIKKEIKDLRAEKLSLPSGNPKRIELHRKIKEMKSLLTEKKEVKIQTDQIYNDPDKIELIAEILRIDPLCELIELNKYTTEQLQKHIEYTKRKRGLND